MFQSWVWIPWGSRLEAYAEFLCCCLENFFFRKPLYLPLRLLSFWIRQSYSFSSSNYGRESWTVKKAEYQRIDAFELQCWRRLLRVPWTARRSNQSILKEISPGCSLEGMMLKVKLPILWPPHAKSWLIGKSLWCWEGLGVEGEGDDRGWDGWKASPTQWTWVWVNSGSWWWTGRPGMLRFMG